MGTYLSTPVTEKCEESGEALCGGYDNDDNNDNNDLPVEWGVVDMQGWRKSMEDAHTAVTSVPIASNKHNYKHARVFGVYDGHGGPEVARFCQYYFVSVLTNQESWIEHNVSNDNNDSNNSNSNSNNNMPLVGDDDRVPSPPPVPSCTNHHHHHHHHHFSNNNPYDGNGNELGYRASHLPAAMETPVGKALRQAFHSLDRMIDDPSRRNEIGALRSNKPAKAATKSLEDGIRSIPPIPSGESALAVANIRPPAFYSHHYGDQQQQQLQQLQQPVDVNAAAAAVAVADTTTTTVEEDAKEDDSTTADADADADAEQQQQQQQDQADKSLSTVMSPEQAEAVKKEIEEFEKNGAADSAAKAKAKDDSESVDSNEPVGQEEAAAFDSDIDSDDDDDDEAATDAADGASVSATATATTEAEAAAPVAASGGKVTSMLQKILSLGGAAAAAATTAATGTGTGTATATATDKDETAAAAEVAAQAEAQAEAAATPPLYPDSSEVNGTCPRNPSVIHNGRLVCNFPDHPIHAGATAVVAVITGKILTVANAGDSRAVLCRRRNSKSNNANNANNATANDSNDDTDTDANGNGNGNGHNGQPGHYAYPLSYDHKPSQTHEMNRILRSGGFVNHFGRINGNLNLSRSIGDLKYKQVPGIPPPHQMITAEPDIMQIALKDDDEFIVLGCDGIWDCLSNEQAVDFVKSRIDTQSPTEIGTEMLDQIISDDPRVTQGIGGDNMTIMIIDLQTAKRKRRRNNDIDNDNDNDATTPSSSSSKDQEAGETSSSSVPTTAADAATE